MASTASNALPHRAEPIVLPPLKKPNLVLIHGFRGSPLGLSEIAGALKRAGFNVYTPPIPPFAGAESLPNYTARDYARYITQYLQDNSIFRPILVGHSMGSIIAAATAHFYPQYLHEKLVLLSPISQQAPRPIAALAPLSSVLPSRTIDYIITRYLFCPTSKADFRKVLDLTRRCSSDHPAKTRDFRASAKFAARSTISDFPFQQKTLLIAGEHDRLIKQSSTKKLAEQFGAELTLLENTGHIHNYEKPQETALAILDFIENR